MQFQLRLCVVIFSIAQILANFYTGIGSKDEERLLLDKFLGYNSLIRPSKTDNKTVIYFGVAMTLLITIDEKNQIMQTNVWLNVKWKDYQLEWKPDDYGGITVIRIPPDKVWLPDIVLFNNADGQYEVSFFSNVVISYTGEIMWIPPAIYKSSCIIDVQYFPFDEQVCPMHFRSWTYSKDEIVIGWYNNKSMIELTDYSYSGIWDITDAPGILSEGDSEVLFQIKVRRKALFYTVILIVPTVLMAFLSVMVYFIPSDASEKMTLAISIQLALVVFLLLVSKMLPPSSTRIPLMAKYLLLTFSLNVITIFVTAIIINVNFRGGSAQSDMSPFTRYFFLHLLPRLLCMVRPRRLIGFPKPKKRLHKLFKEGGPLDDYPVSSLLPIASEVHLKAGRTIVTTRSSHGPLLCCVKGKSETQVRPLLNDDNGGCINIDFKAPTLSSTQRPAKFSALHKQLSFERRNRANGKSTERFVSTRKYNPDWLQPEIRAGIQAVGFISEHAKENEVLVQTENEWRYVGMVIDRLLLLIFFAVTTSGTLGILLSAPNIFDSLDQKAIIDRLNVMGSYSRRFVDVEWPAEWRP